MATDKLTLNQNKKYLESHNVTKCVEELMAGILKEKPDEPLLFMMKFIQKKAQQNGIYLPLQSKMSNDGGQGDSPALSRSYDKPWLNGSAKKSDFRGSLHQTIVDDNNSQTKLENDIPININTNLDEEFRLANTLPEENVDKEKAIEESYELLKAAKSQIGTKELLLQLVKEEENKQIAEKEKLMEKIAEKDILCETIDSAVELETDPDVLQNEFNVSNPATIPPATTIVVKKQIVSRTNGSEVNAALKLTMCPNCAKFFPSGASNSSVNHYASPACNNSVILDDLESASQVNGPRPIGNNRQNQQINTKKLISVANIEGTSNAWPVIDSNSDLSTSKKSNSRPRPSSRQFLP